MPEAEEVLSDAARHATVFARDLWQRHRKRPDGPPVVVLSDVASRIDLLITTVFGHSPSIRVAQPPAPPTLLGSLFARRRLPRFPRPLPATDGVSLWLPGDLGISETQTAQRVYRTMALQQAMRAERGAAAQQPHLQSSVAAEIYLLLEAAAADQALLHLLPGMSAAIHEFRQAALGSRPPLDSFPAHARSLETFLRNLLCRDHGRWSRLLRDGAPPAETADAALAIARELYGDEGHGNGPRKLMPDWWVGELLPPPPAGRESIAGSPGTDEEEMAAPCTSRMRRRPDVREAAEDEDDDSGKSGPWMVQADDPHQKAEDPMGLTRPTDRGDEDAAELGDMLSDIPAARLVSTPGRPKEVLLSDDPPEGRAQRHDPMTRDGEWRVQYPEWDYRAAAFRMPGATVRVSAPLAGSQAWVDATLDAHRAMLQSIRRRFEMLQARRVVLRRQQDGDDIDLESCVDAIADLRAGSHMTDGLYRTTRANERQMAIMLLIDVSGSTDGWISANRRIIDVEREALLLVGIALRELGEPFAIQAFSGEGPSGVTVRSIKTFDEPFANDTALRIAALEPEHYTRAGAALRHAAAGLMQQPADHRLLLLLSDGKPNDVDIYEGRYGVEDMHQAVTEARLQGVFPFCLTIDRQAANYLPRIFGANQYAMLPRPELLPSVLLDWMRRLLRD